MGSVSLNVVAQSPRHHNKSGSQIEQDTTIDTNAPKAKIKDNTGNNTSYGVRETSFDKAMYNSEIETPVDLDSLPKAARKYIAKNYPHYEIGATTKIIDKNKTVTYEAELKKQKESFELVFDADGRYLTTEPDDDDF